MNYTSFVWSPLTTILVLLAMALYSWRYRRLPGALPFMAACLFATLSITGVYVVFLNINPASKIFWFRFQGAWIPAAATALTCFVLEYAWPNRWLTRRNLALLSILPLLSVFYFLGLAVAQAGYVEQTPFDLASRVVIVYVYVTTLINLAIFGWLFIHSPQHRWPATIMASAAVYIAINMGGAAPVSESQILIFLSLTWPYLAYAIALFGFRIFDPIPLARQLAIHQLHAGMVVLDPQDRVVSLNPAAERILGASARQARGRPVSHWLPDYPEKPGGGEGEICLGPETESRWYTLATSPLKDFRGLAVGSLLLLRDITEHKQAQAQILEQQSALAALQERERLARDLHDDLAQTLAFLNVQAQASHELLATKQVALADEHLLRLAAVARQAHAQVRALITDLRSPTLAEASFIERLNFHLEQFGVAHGLQTEFETTPGAALPATFTPHMQEQLFHIVQEALTNIRKHAHATSVHIHLAVLEGQVRVAIEDDGIGFDAGLLVDEKEHLGLRIMQERAAAAGGRIEIQSAPNQGARIIVEVPRSGA